MEFLEKEDCSQEQISLACAFYGEYPEDFVWEADSFTQLYEEVSQRMVKDFKDIRRMMCPIQVGELEEVFSVTAEARTSVSRTIIHAAKLNPDEIYSSLTPEAMTLGELIATHIYPIFIYANSGMVFDTLVRIGTYIVCEAMGKNVYDFPKDILIGALVYATGLIEWAIMDGSEDVNDGIDIAVERFEDKYFAKYAEHILKPSLITIDALDALDAKFQALTDERDALQRRLNRNREIAVAIWKLQTMADKDFKFRYKYQWIGIYEVMCGHHLLSDEEKSTFCRICNSPDSPDYFLPDNEHELPNPYVPGESWEKDSTWHQLSSHGDTPRQRREIDKTKKEFSLLLKEHGIIE